MAVSQLKAGATLNYVILGLNALVYAWLILLIC